jgi:hypothetical protein
LEAPSVSAALADLSSLRKSELESPAKLGRASSPLKNLASGDAHDAETDLDTPCGFQYFSRPYLATSRLVVLTRIVSHRLEFGWLLLPCHALDYHQLAGKI